MSHGGTCFQYGEQHWDSMTGYIYRNSRLTLCVRYLFSSYTIRLPWIHTQIAPLITLGLLYEGSFHYESSPIVFYYDFEATNFLTGLIMALFALFWSARFSSLIAANSRGNIIATPQIGSLDSNKTVLLCMKQLYQSPAPWRACITHFLCKPVVISHNGSIGILFVRSCI